MRAIVINPPFLEPHRPPISCAIIGEIFRLNGYDVEVLDLNIELFHTLGIDRFIDCQNKHSILDDDGDELEVINDLFREHLTIDKLQGVEFIALSCFSYWNLKMTRALCEYLRPKTQAQIIVGGPGLEYNNTGQKLWKEGLVNYYVMGEGEVALDRIINGNADQCPGVNGVPPEQITDIENLPLPNYALFDLTRYDWLLDAPDVIIYGSRGCVRKCSFCDVQHFWPKFRWRSGTSIADEMISNYEKFGIRYFHFADSLVNGNLKEFESFSQRLANYRENFFKWSGLAIVRPRGQHTADHFDMIKASGAMQWQVGLETGVDRIRFEMKKKFTNDDIDWHLEQSQRVGLRNLFLMIPTWHTETLDEHQQYLQIFDRWQPFAVDGTILGLSLTNTVEMLPDAPMGALEGKEYIFDPKFSNNQKLRTVTWLNPANPSLTHQEKFRRTIAIYETAIKKRWPVHNRTARLLELQTTMQGIVRKLGDK
jgi:hypothetical protein